MVLMADIEVLATSHHGIALSSLTAPLSTISNLYGVSFFKIRSGSGRVSASSR